MAGFLPFLLILGIFYFLLILPMQRQKKNQQKMLRELQNGNVVLTNGGIVGTIVAIDPDIFEEQLEPGIIQGTAGERDEALSPSAKLTGKSLADVAGGA